jgi:hypothetical protein
LKVSAVFSLAYALFAAVHAVLAVLLARAAVGRRSVPLGLAALVAAGLVYDNGVVAAGRLIGEGGLLMALNHPRFVIHALLTPLLIVTAVGLARACGAGWARARAVHVLAWCLALGLVGYGLVAEVYGLELAAAPEGDALRYSAAHTAPPVPAIVTVVALLAAGLATVRRGGAWMAGGAAAMFAASAVHSAPMAIANLGEVAFLAGIAMTAHRTPAAPTPRPAGTAA